MQSLLVFLMLAACGPKEEPPVAAAAVAEPAAAPAPAAATEPEPVVEEAPAAAVSNADLMVTLTRANGSSVSGKVRRIERSEDWFGEEGWNDEKSGLKIDAESSSAFKQVFWTDVASVSIKPGGIPSDVDCVYDSNWSPWMYDCTLKTTGTVSLKDGSKWTVSNRHKWRFTFESGEIVEFWLNKHPAREQDEAVVDLNTANPENFDLYTKLQHRLRDEVKNTIVVKVDVK
jgi:hypothetical protein